MKVRSPLLLVVSILALLGGSRAEAGTATAAPSSTPAPSLTSPLEEFGESILHPRDPYQVIPGRDASGWSFTLEPYLWALGISADLGVKPLPSAHVDLTPKNILQHLDWGVMAKAELRKGRWGLLGDGLFAQLSAGADAPGPFYDSASMKMQQGIASLALAYRVIDDRRGFLRRIADRLECAGDAGGEFHAEYLWGAGVSLLLCRLYEWGI